MKKQAYEVEVTLENQFAVNKRFKTATGGTTDYNELDNKPSINNIELINNKTLEELGVRDLVIQILKEYGLISDGPLTPEEIQALNEMDCTINENGVLTITYDNNVLDIDFRKEGTDLIVDNNINATFNINQNGELEVNYDNN